MESKAQKRKAPGRASPKARPPKRFSPKSGTKKRTALKITLLIVLLTAAFSGIIIGIKFAYDTYSDSSYPLEYEDEVSAASKEYNVPEALIYGVIKTESNFDPNAVSAADARGLMQLTQPTFEWLNTYYADDDYDSSDADLLFEPEINIKYGTLCLSVLLERYNNDLDTAICAYNAGLGNVDEWLSMSEYSSDGLTLDSTPFEETNEYLKRVKANRDKYTQLYFSE